jgi:hypothetical protein
MRDFVSVHDAHCCQDHGCKYGDSDCPVVLRKEEGIWCEDCEDFINDLPNICITDGMIQERMKKMAKKDVFDFGFTIEAEEPIADDRAERMYKAIKPLLDNLKKNPEVDTIKWPNRVQKIDEFEQKLAEIAFGSTPYSDY